MKDKSILKTGIIGSAITAVCCFTPILVIGLGVVGLSAWLGWLDYVLFPALAVFLAMTAYGFYLRRKNAAGPACAPAGVSTTKRCS
jgi:mercuric ion transport protein